MAGIILYRTDSNSRSADEAPVGSQEMTVQQALVIGVKTYSANPLDNAAKDAQDIADILKDQYGFTLLPTGEPLLNENATGLKIKEIIEESLAKADSKTRWLFYFAGHGKVHDVDNLTQEMYLLPVDVEQGNVDKHLALTWLLERCRQSEAGEILLILDACYSGWALVQLNDLIPVANGIGVRQVISAGNPNQRVLDGGAGQHSIFTQALLDSLEGLTGAHEPDGRIRFSQLLTRIRDEMPQRLAYVGLSPDQQIPVGGYFIGNDTQRGFIFHSRIELMPPDLLHDLHSNDINRRIDAIRRFRTIALNQKMVIQAIQITSQCLQPSLSKANTHVIQFDKTDLSLRAEAAETLGALLMPMIGRPKASDPKRILNELEFEASLVGLQSSSTLNLLDAPQGFAQPDNPQPTVLTTAWQGLLNALDDDLPVARAAAAALGRLGLDWACDALLKKLATTSDDLFLDLADAISAIGETNSTVAMLREAMRRGKLVPMLGPDLPQELTGAPSRTEFINNFIHTYGNYGLDAPISLAKIAKAAKNIGIDHDFARELRRPYENQLFVRQLIKRPFYAALPDLHIPLWLSACYDDSLVQALDAYRIVTGKEAKRWDHAQPAVACLAGNWINRAELVFTEEEYEKLRTNEADRKLLVDFLTEELHGKIVLCLGFDPASLDFRILVKHIFNQHLVNASIMMLLAWPETASASSWSGRRLHNTQQSPLALVSALQTSPSN